MEAANLAAQRAAARRALVNYVWEGFKVRPPFQTDFELKPYRDFLPKGTPGTPDLVRILTTVAPKATGIRQEVMLLDELVAVVKNQPNTANKPFAPELFLRGWEQHDPADDTYFETWTHLIRRIASTTPGRRGEAGVSLYHEFKLLSALIHAALLSPRGLQDNFTLISGDFPGVQNTIYTISSDGATKGVRGRSFFLQLLAECTVRRLLADVGELPITNVLKLAGGNFLILAPAGVAEHVAALNAELSRGLLDLFYGDISLITATLPVNALALSKPINELYSQLKQSEGRRKLQPSSHFRPCSAPQPALSDFSSHTVPAARWRVWSASASRSRTTNRLGRTLIMPLEQIGYARSVKRLRRSPLTWRKALIRFWSSSAVCCRMARPIMRKNCTM